MRIVHRNPESHGSKRKGATIVLILFLLVAVFIFVAFAIDIGRIQLAQLKLQTASDFAARAGAEALARGVGDVSDLGDFEASIRAEADMVMQKNQLFGTPIAFDSDAEIEFGIAEVDTSQGNGNGNAGGNGNGKAVGRRFNFNGNTGLVVGTNSVRVSPDLNQFPLMFSRFVGRDSVNLHTFSTARVQERAIVVVLDKSTSMLENDAGDISLNDYPNALFQVEDDLYREGDAYFPGGPSHSDTRTSEFEVDGNTITLTKMQALKLALYRFREVIDRTPGNEQLGMTAYSDFADVPANAPLAPGPVDIFSGLSTLVFNDIVTDGICDNFETPNAITETAACALEDRTSDYDNFDFNYLKMRWSDRTNIVDGIEVGTDILFNSPDSNPASQPILIIMTDGRHNTIEEGDAETTDIAAQNAIDAHPNLIIHTITFGAGADTDAMDSVATIGRGRHFHAADVNALVDVFEDLAQNAGVTMIE